MNAYLDSSAILKLFLEEPHSGVIKDLVREAERSATSLVAWAEARASLARAMRSGRLTMEEHGDAVAKLHEFWERTSVVDVTEALVLRAGDLAMQYYLRGLDAIQLASALVLNDEIRGSVTFFAFDGRLTDAADACGLDAWRPA